MGVHKNRRVDWSRSREVGIYRCRSVHLSSLTERQVEVVDTQKYRYSSPHRNTDSKIWKYAVSQNNIKGKLSTPSSSLQRFGNEWEKVEPRLFWLYSIACLSKLIAFRCDPGATSWCFALPHLTRKTLGWFLAFPRCPLPGCAMLLPGDPFWCG